MMAGGRGPEAVCIARSDGDGFTDVALVRDLTAGGRTINCYKISDEMTLYMPAQVDKVQVLVVDVIKKLNDELWSPGAGVEIHDIADDPFVKCSMLFRNENIVKHYVVNNDSINANVAKKRKIELHNEV